MNTYPKIKRWICSDCGCPNEDMRKNSLCDNCGKKRRKNAKVTQNICFGGCQAASISIK